MKFEILADFDGTLTLRGSGHGNSFSVLRDAMNPEGKKFADNIYAQYSHKEYDFSLSDSQRDSLMKEWWIKEFEGIARHNVHINDIKSASMSSKLILRPYVKELFDMADKNNIPILILTAGVVDIIVYKLQLDGLIELDEGGNIVTRNVKIIGNKFIYNNKGYIIGTVPPLVYITNKYSIMKSLDKNMHADTAFVLGDHPQDIEMCDPANHKKVIRFGFLNGKTNNGEYDKYDYLYEDGNASMEDVYNKIKEEVAIGD